MAETKIEWADVVWNPQAGCTPASAGCHNCYAAKEAVRLAGNPNAKIAAKYEGTARMTGEGSNRRAVFTGRVNFAEEALAVPLQWRKPRRIFQDSESDLFHDEIPVAWIRRVWATMALSPRHTYLILTKRAERMADVVGALTPGDVIDAVEEEYGEDACVFAYNWISGWSRPKEVPADGNPLNGTVKRWPLPNAHLGVSCEDQAAADERIPHLLQTPAAVRFLSCEPLLGPIDLRNGAIYGDSLTRTCCRFGRGRRDDGADACDGPGCMGTAIDQVIIGGESGPHARLCNVEWIRSLVRQCRDAGVAPYVKQFGARPYTDDLSDAAIPYLMTVSHDIRDGRATLLLEDAKGGDPAQWPEDLRVREMPEARP